MSDKMSIIAIRGMPPKLKLQMLIRKLAHVIKCQFQAFEAPHKTKEKTYFLKLPEKLDPFQAINMINDARFPYEIEAFIPVINYDLKVPPKAKKVPQNLRKSLGIPNNLSSPELLQRTHKQILTEMLSKFTKLYTLSKTTNHQLLHTLCQIVHQRLEGILRTQEADSCYNLSKYYRHNYVHTKDFELIRDLLMKIQKSKEMPCQEINENEFCLYKPEDNDIGDLSIIGNDTLETIGKKYSDKIIAKIMDHIQNFNKDIRPDNQQDLVTAEVRQHINNVAPLIPTIIKTVIRNKLITKTYKQPFEILRIYGEPFLPNKERMHPFLKHFSYKSIQRSEDIFNLITVRIPTSNYLKILKCDGNIVSGARIVIRPLMGKELSAQVKEITSTTDKINMDVQEFCI